MKKSIRFISAILTVLMFMSSVVIAHAAEPAVEDGNYLTTPFTTEEEKLATMKLERDQNGYELYCDEYTGEIALKKKSTGQILFSNPYDVGALGVADSTKEQLLSQIIIGYMTIENEEKEPMTSYKDAVVKGKGTQIQVENIRDGIRVEYTIGRQETRRLIPRMIRKDRFEELILNNITDDFERGKLDSFYVKFDPDDPTLSERSVAEMKATYPITNRMAIYVCAADIEIAEEDRVEQIIKTYCPEYTYETLDEDHTITEYSGNADVAPPLFRLALEYTLDDEGLTVRLPANGIRYDDTAYILQYVDVLPFMGAISSEYEGYTFIPDGSGALIEADKLAGKTWNRECQMYGYNFAYQQLMDSVTNPQEDTRFPVWGAVTHLGDMTVTDTIKEAYTTTDPETGEEIRVPAETEKVTIQNDKGYVAFITEGESLAKLRYVNGGSVHKYAYAYARLEPRPFDTYNLSEGISAAANAEWAVVSPRKYVDSYRIKYVMLDGKDHAERAGLTDYYDTSYFGMAKAYRNYLESAGILTRLTNEDVSKNMPLYIETLGTLQTSEKFLSIPITVDTPLTTFDNIIMMYEELSAAGVDNVNFRLIGFANGGLSDATVPYNLKWENAVGGNDGFRKLIEYAKGKNMGIFPDFDFAYAPNDKMFDGFSYRAHAVKTIDDRYTSKRYYDATTQNFTRRYEIAISASVFEYFYDHFAENYSKYEPTGISVSTLGSDLNSDFDKKDPYNREDAKRLTTDLLAKIAESYDVMVDAGNAFTYKYVNHIINMKFESSRFFNASYSVPFNGLVLHGYINTASTPINEEGDIESALLRAIESGSSLNFLFAYQNVEKLKQDKILNKYYSVRYNIWFDDLVNYYNIVNEAIGDLQTALITGHEFLNGERVPDADEAEADRIAAEAKAEADRIAAELAAAREEAAKKLAERIEAEALEREIANAVADTSAMIEEISALLDEIVEQQNTLNSAIEQLSGLKASVDAVKKPLDEALAAVEAAKAALDEAQAALAESEDEDKSALEADVAEKQAALVEAQGTVAEYQAAYDAVIAETEYEKIYNKAVAAANAAAKTAESAAELAESAQHKVEITASEATASTVAANAAEITRIARQIQNISGAIENAVKTTLKGYSLVEDEEPEQPEEPEEPEDPADPDDSEDPSDPDDSEDPSDQVEETVSKYAVTDGSIVLVTYETGKRFILNYNGFAVKVVVDGVEYTVEPYSFYTINK